MLRITAALKAEGRTLADRLDELTARDGLHATSQLSVRVDDLQIIADAMTRLRSEPPATLLGRDVAFRDLLDHQPPTNGVELTGEGVRVVVRPSGTEPKLKCYCEVVLSPAESADASAARQHAAELLEQIKQELRLCLGLT